MAWLVRRLLLASVLNRPQRSRRADALTALSGAGQGLAVGALILATLAGLPPAPGWREDILAAPLAGPLVQAVGTLEQPVERAFGPAIRQLVRRG